MDGNLILGVLLVACLALLASAAWALAARARRAEEDLRRLRGLDVLNDRVATIADSVGRLDLSRSEAALHALEEAAPRLERAVWRMEEALARLQAPAAPGGTSLLRQAIEARLRDLGYEHVRIQETESSAPSSGDPLEVAVEATKGEVAHKGRVLVRAGTITEVQLRPVYGIFP